jgi:PAS domain S-box-containing protein
LKESEEKIRVAFNQTFQFMGLLELDGTLLKVNQTALEFAGIEEKDVLGKPFWETIWWTHSAELQDKIRDAVKKVANGQLMNLEVSHLAHDGTLHNVDFSLKPVKDDSGKIRYLVAEGHDITEYKRAVDELKIAKEFSESLIETASAIIVTLNHEAIITTFNGYAENLTGYTKEDVLGRNWFDIFISQKDKETIPKVYGDAINNMPAASQHENSILTKSGEERLISWNNNTLQDASGNICGLLRIGIDITKRKLAEEKQRESEERFRAIFETAEDSIFIKDCNFRYVQANPAMENLFGMSVSEIIGKTDDELFGEEAGAHIREADTRVLNGEILREEHTKSVNDVAITFNIVKVPMRDVDGNIIGLCGIARDVTETKRLQALISSDCVALPAMSPRPNGCRLWNHALNVLKWRVRSPGR